MAVTRQNPFPPSPTFPYGSPGAATDILPSWNLPVTYQPPPLQVNANITSGQRNSFLNSLMSPEALAAIATGGLGVGQSIFQNRANAGENAKDRQLTMAQLLSGISGDELADMRGRQLGYMNTFQMDPVSQSRDIFSAGLLRDMAGRGASVVQPGQGVTNPFRASAESLSALSPENLAENASRFYGAAGQINPYAQRADLGQMFGEAGAGRQGEMDASIDAARQRYENLNKQRRDDLINAIQMQQQQQEQKKGGGFMKKLLGGIALGASAFIPGMPAVLAPYLIGAGSGMALGGTQGAISGAAGAGVGQANDYFTRRAGK